MKPDESHVVYDGNLIDVTLERWGDNEREIVEHPGAVAIVAVDRERQLWLVRQLREPRAQEARRAAGGQVRARARRRSTLRGASCARSAGSPAAAGRSSVRSGRHRASAASTCVVFLAGGRRGQVRRSSDDDEEVEVVRGGRLELDVEALIGELEDAKTLAGLLLFRHHPARQLESRLVRIGVAKEIKTDEYRVALTPAGARELVAEGPRGARRDGRRRRQLVPRRDYERAGARIVSVDDVWAQAELLLKVKEPIAAEYPRLREGLVLFTYLHIAADEPLTRALVDSGIAAVAYETVETDDRRLPLLAPMSEIAGRLAAQAGAYFLEKPLGGRGLLLGGVPGVAPGPRLVLGGGVVGYNAAIIAIGLGAQVTILDRSIDRMRHLDEILSGRVSTRDVVERCRSSRRSPTPTS